MSVNFKWLIVAFYLFNVASAQVKPVAVLFDPGSKYAAGYNIDRDTLNASFSIYYKNYIDENVRRQILAEYKKNLEKAKSKTRKNNNIPNIKPVKHPRFYKWYISIDPPIRINEKDLPGYVSLDEFVNQGSLNSDTVEFIFKLSEYEFLIWKGFHIREK